MTYVSTVLTLKGQPILITYITSSFVVSRKSCPVYVAPLPNMYSLYCFIVCAVMT